MASEKTSNIGLNKWVPTDYVKMDEFNENFDKIDEVAADHAAQLAEKAEQSYVDALLSNITDGSPKELFYSLNALQTKYPNGAIGPMLVLDSSFTDGAHSFFWDSASSTWKDIGIYQSKIDAETVDIRVGADGKTYASAGEAVREVGKSALNNELNLFNAVGKIADAALSDYVYSTGFDISSLTSAIANARYWNNGFVAPQPLYLTGITVRTDASTVNVLIYKKDDTSFTLIRDCGILSVVNGVVQLNYLLQKGCTVFVRFNSGNYYYKTDSTLSSFQLENGTFTSSNVLVSFNLNYTKLGLNFYNFSSIKDNLPQLEALAKNLTKWQPSNNTFIDNQIDLTAATLTVTNTRYYTNGKITTAGFLKGIYFKTSATSFKVIAGKISNGVFQITYNYGTFLSSNLDSQSYLAINDAEHYLAIDEYIFILQTGTFNYKSATGVGYQMESDYSNLKVSDVQIGFNILLAEAQSSGSLTIDDVNEISDNVTNLQNDVDVIKEKNISIMSKKYMPVFENDFSSANTALTVLNDTAGSAWSFDYTNKYAYPNALGGYYNDGTANLALQNVLKLNKRYECDLKVLKFDVVLYSDTVLNVHMFRNQHTNEIPNESLYVIDIPNNKLRMTTLNGRQLMVGTYAAEKAIGFNIVNGNKYQIEIEKRDYTFYLRIKDYLSGKITELSLVGWAAGSQLSYYGFSWGAGATSPKISKLAVYMPEKPEVAFAGDSISEGYGMSSLTGDNSFGNRFAELARIEIGDCVISAASSGTISDIIEKFDSEYSIYKPKILFVTIGTNGDTTLNSVTNYTQLKTLCDQNGIKLILNHIPCSTSSSVNYAQKNTNIDAVQNDGVKFDIATAVNNNIANGADSSLFSDGTHPNYSGSQLMFNRIKVDRPELFY